MLIVGLEHVSKP